MVTEPNQITCMVYEAGGGRGAQSMLGTCTTLKVFAMTARALVLSSIIPLLG
jgi:hypothetical protein